MDKIEEKKYHWKKLISYNRECGKRLIFNKYIEATVVWNALHSQDKDKPYSAYINNTLLVKCKTEKECMEIIEKELNSLRKEDGQN
jgi:hypothetical protein